MTERKRVALITGGGQGIGLAIAGRLAAENLDIAICDIQENSVMNSALDDLRRSGAEVLYSRADVGDRAARARMLEDVRTKFGRLNVLVNNAGVAPAARADILAATEESYERVMRVNLQGPYFLTQAAARWMIEQKKADQGFQGCIVNISSVSATVASPNRGEYCISKAGISMATKLWAARLGEFDIPVYEIRPGIIRSGMTDPVKEKYDKLIDGGLCLQSRWGLPEDVARAVAMIVRDELPYSTGQVIMIDGGLTLQRM